MNPCFTRTVSLDAPKNGASSLTCVQQTALQAVHPCKTACQQPRQAPQFAPWAEAATHRLDPPM